MSPANPPTVLYVTECVRNLSRQLSSHIFYCPISRPAKLRRHATPSGARTPHRVVPPTPAGSLCRQQSWRRGFSRPASHRNPGLLNDLDRSSYEHGLLHLTKPERSYYHSATHRLNDGSICHSWCCTDDGDPPRRCLPIRRLNLHKTMMSSQPKGLIKSLPSFAHRARSGPRPTPCLPPTPIPQHPEPTSASRF